MITTIIVTLAASLHLGNGSMKAQLITTTLAALLFANAAYAAQTNLQIELATQSDFERHVVSYECGAETSLVVTYINAAPNFLAIVPVAEEPDDLVFASVLSGSGARYAAGKWIWWNTGTDASLYDSTLGDDAEAVLTCSEIINTP